jgi:vitellogenic carboxypeptidase-like protein
LLGVTLIPRTTSWTSKYSMIFVDNPVGTGFSFTDDTRGYVTNENDVANDMYIFLEQFFTIFPDYQKNGNIKQSCISSYY